MVVFVDDMYKSPMGRYRGMKMSHMIASSEAELHKMAAKIGVARRWYQGDHYDICFSKRQLAIKYGAVEITWRALGLKVMALRKNNAASGFTQAVETPKTGPGTPASPQVLRGPSRSGEAQ